MKPAEDRPPWGVGARVERELDGLWFAATVVGVDAAEGTVEIEYDEDQNRETDVGADELRALDDNNQRPATAKAPAALTPQQYELLARDSLLLQAVASDYDPNKAPTVVLHHRGETQTAASAYIINGLENNIAAGNGLRGIRWLRVNTM